MRYMFGDCTLDTEQYLLYRATHARPLQPKVFQVLHYLLTHRNRVIAKGELQTQVWPQQFISEATLEGVIKAVRHAVGDDGRTQWCIQTRRGQGYRFVAPITLVPGAETGDQSLPPTALPLLAERPSRSLVEAEALPPPDRPALPASPGSALPDAERRQVTLLFCDLVGSTALSGQLDPEDLRAVLQAYLGICTEVIARFGGNIDKFLGDGALVCFGYPQAHDDDPQRAVRAGLGIVAAMAQLNTRFALTGGVQLAVRIGIHTGLVVAGALEVGQGRAPQAIVGEVPNIAARLQERAGPNTVVLSAATARLVEGYFILEALGPQVLKGVARPVPVYRVVRASAAQTRFDVAATRGLTPLVGREAEGALLREHWAQVKDGWGQVVLLSGEGGIGKSRLAQAFTAQLSGEAYTQIVYHCSPYHQQSALYPVVAYLQRLLHIRPDDPPAAQLHALEATLRAYDFALEETVPLLAALLSWPPLEHYPLGSLTPERQKQKTLDTLLTWVQYEAARQPVCVIVEDLHWGDPSTLEFLTLLVHQIPLIRVLLLLLCRPEFQPPWALGSYTTPLVLRRLSPPQTIAMITQVTGDPPLPAALVQHIGAVTDGVPLFVEELTKMVLESGLVTARDGRYAFTGSLPALAIPATLHDVLMARLDRLGSAKQVAQLAAVVGRECAYAVLQAVTPLAEGVLQQGLTQLVAADLLYQRGVPPRAQYRFKHALIQEAAYQSVLQSARRQYHQQIAEVLEAQFPETGESHPELLAHHYTAAGRSAQAVGYWQRAGQRASTRSAYQEAVTCFEQALGALARLPETRETRTQAIDVRLDLRHAFFALGAYEHLRDCLHSAITLAEAVGDRRRLGQSALYMAQYCSATGEHERAIVLGQQALAIGTTLTDGALQVCADQEVGVALWALGDYGRAVTFLQRSITSLQGDLAPLSPMTSLGYLGLCHAAVGEFAEGISCAEEAVRLAEVVDNPLSLTSAYRVIGSIYLTRGELTRAIALLQRGQELCHVADVRVWLPPTKAALGYPHALSGHIAEAIPLLEQAVEQDTIWRGGGYAHGVAWLGETYLLASRREEALPLATRALELSHTRKERGNEAWTLRLLGEIARRCDPPDVVHAVASYQQALALANALGMRPLQAHCHRGLGLLYATAGQQEQARAALAAAIAMYRSLDMTFWLPQTEAALAQLAER